MIKKQFLLFFVILLLTVSILTAKKGTGLGVIIGEPTGISIKIWTAQKTAIDAAVAWSLGKHDAFHIHMDYLIHNFRLLPVSKGRLPFYFGIGGRMVLAERTQIGIRFPAGIAYHFADAPVDLFLEIVPILNLTPGTEISFNGAIGIRYYF